MDDGETGARQPQEDLVGCGESGEHIERFAVERVAGCDLALQLATQRHSIDGTRGACRGRYFNVLSGLVRP